MIIELNEEEKDIISRALVHLTLDKEHMDCKEEDVKNLWVKIQKISIQHEEKQKEKLTNV